MKKADFEAHEERDMAVNSLRSLVNEVEKVIDIRTVPVALLRSLNQSRLVLSQLDVIHKRKMKP